MKRPQNSDTLSGTPVSILTAASSAPGRTCWAPAIASSSASTWAFGRAPLCAGDPTSFGSDRTCARAGMKTPRGVGRDAEGIREDAARSMVHSGLEALRDCSC